MNDGIDRFVDKLSWVYTHYDLDTHKLLMLGVCNDWWISGKIRVTDLLKSYKATSPATTHRNIHSLIENKLLKVVVDKNDKRQKYLVEGANFSKLESVLGGK